MCTVHGHHAKPDLEDPFGVPPPPREVHTLTKPRHPVDRTIALEVGANINCELLVQGPLLTRASPSLFFSFPPLFFVLLGSFETSQINN